MWVPLHQRFLYNSSGMKLGFQDFFKAPWWWYYAAMVESHWIQSTESVSPGARQENQYILQKPGDSYDQERWVNIDRGQCPHFFKQDITCELTCLKTTVNLLNSKSLCDTQNLLFFFKSENNRAQDLECALCAISKSDEDIRKHPALPIWKNFACIKRWH